MRLWIDTADLEDIRSGLVRGCSGVTTNPTILARARGEPMAQLRAIVDILRSYNVPLSVELLQGDRDALERQMAQLLDELRYDELVVKVPVGWTECVNLATLAYYVNVTAVMSYAQAIVAAAAGARYVSIFWGRIADIGGEPARVVDQVRSTFDRNGASAEIVVGSIRHVRDAVEALQAGAHIVTLPPPTLYAMYLHPQTDAIVAQFERDGARAVAADVQGAIAGLSAVNDRING